jgi:hypothetical protein
LTYSLLVSDEGIWSDGVNERSKATVVHACSEVSDVVLNLSAQHDFFHFATIAFLLHSAIVI